MADPENFKKVPTMDDLNEWNQLLREGNRHTKNLVASDIHCRMGSRHHVTNVDEADSVIRQFFQASLDNGAYLPMAVMIGGRDYIDERSVMVRDVFWAMQNHALNAFAGGSSLSKTFAATIYSGMDWLADPDHTAVRLAGVNDTNLKAFLFNGLRRFLENSVIDFGLHYANLYIGKTPDNREGSISGVTFPQDSKETGRFKGFHPVPRMGGAHLRFGTRTRIRLLLDEASNMPDGVYQDLSSMMSSIDDVEHVKVTLCFNPHDDGHWTGKACAPKNGIHSIDPENDHKWISAEGFHVTRLDGKYCENVIAKKTVIPSMMSYDFYKKLEAQGVESPRYWIYARGMWPPKGSYTNVIPRYLLDNRKVTPLFVGPVTNCGFCDLAILQDRIILISARWGRATGYIDSDGKRIMFDATNPNPNLRRDKELLWMEQCFELRPNLQDVAAVAEAIMSSCKALQISPDWLAVDSTGSGIGPYHHLRNFFGNVLGIGWGESASDVKILSDDTKLPSEVYADCSTEMWYATKSWLEYDIIFFSPEFNTDPCFDELSKRRIPLMDRNKQGKLRVEPKAKYKAREGRSPDCFVAGTMVLTDKGEIPIEQITIGDLIVTPFGTSPVEYLHCHESKDIHSVRTTHNRILSGLGKHEIFTWNRGWARLDTLMLTDTMESATMLPIWHLLNLLFTRVKHTTNTQGSHITIMAGRSRRGHFIESSGLSTMGLSLRIWKSITRILILRITGFKIWTLSKSPSTDGCTWSRKLPTPTTTQNSKPDKRRRLLQQWLGTSRQRATSGTSKTAGTLFRCVKNPRSNAWCAGEHLERCGHPEQGTAHINAGLRSPTINIALRKLARNAARSLLLFVTRTRNVALLAVEPRHLTADVKVYNLTLREFNVYYANGILVKNCADSLIMGQQLIRRRSDLPPSMTDRPAEAPYEMPGTVHTIDSLQGSFDGDKKQDSGSLADWIERQTSKANQA